MRATRAVIDLAAIRDNYRYAGELAPRSRTLPVIKADAYGHGLLEVAHTLAPLAPGLAVAIVDEAIALREAGLALPGVLAELQRGGLLAEPPVLCTHLVVLQFNFAG